MRISRPKLGYGPSFTYSGGLGVLAGDHVKSPADAGLPLVGMSLLYREVTVDSIWMHTASNPKVYGPIDPADHLTNTGVSIQLPLDGKTCMPPFGKRTWLAYPATWFRFISSTQPTQTTRQASTDWALACTVATMRCASDRNTCWAWAVSKRFKALGHDFAGMHLNEGHCTFAMLEMLRQGWSREELAQRTLFTTHTPVPAGHDRFEWSLVREVIGDLLPEDAQDLVRNA